MLDKYDVLSYNGDDITLKGEMDMKRLICALLAALMLLCGMAVAEEIDFASMDDSALHAMIDGARNELTKRELIAAENTVLFEQDGVTVYLTGDHEVWGSDSYYLDMGVVLVNDSEKTVFLTVNTAYINGWEVYGGGITDTDAGKKQKANLDFGISDAGITTYEEIEEIEINFWLCDAETYETIAEVGPVVIHCNVQ